MTRLINPAGLAIIKEFEGFRAAAYLDIPGIWTIGYGHTRGVAPTDVISEAQGEIFLKQDLAAAEDGVNSLLGQFVTTDNEFSAMVPLAFNIGLPAFHSSSVLRDHLANRKSSASRAFLMWDKAHVDGQLVDVPGLYRRRQAERALYLT